MSDPYFIYAIKSSGGESAFLLAKIGISSNPWSRMNTLQTGNPFDLDIVATVEVPSRDAAYSLERSFREENDCFWVRGEWYEFPAEGFDIEAYLQDHVSPHTPMPT